MNVFSIIGRPFCGKGTIAKLFKDCEILPMSDLFRELLSSPTHGTRIKEAMDSGNLVPDDIAIPTFMKAWEKRNLTANLVLDGCVRTELQAREIAWILRMTGTYEIFQIVVEVPTEVCWQRFRNPQNGRGSRADDKERVLENRFRVYERLTEPAIEVFSEEFVGRTIYVNNERDPNATFLEIQRKLKSIMEGSVSEEAKKFQDRAASMGFSPS